MNTNNASGKQHPTNALVLGFFVLLLTGTVQTISAAHKGTPGTPWTGEMGITETVNQIMARTNKQEHPLANPTSRSHHTGDEDEEDPAAVNPLAPLVPQYPAPPTTLIQGPVPLLPQIVGTSFVGIQLSESSAIPPDSMGAVGPSQILCIANGRIKLFSKSGGGLALNTTTDSFFHSVRGTSGTSDPHIRYDRLSGRWFVVMINVANKSNRILIAVSSGSTITDATSFTFFQFAEDFDGGDAGLFADYPTLGVDRFALYIGVNNFLSLSGGNATRAGFVVNKASLLAGGPIVVTSFRNLDDDGAGNGIKTPQGVDNDDPNSTEGYFIGVDAFVTGKLDIRRISDPGGTPTISSSLTITVPATSPPIPQAHKVDQLNKKLDPVSDRLFAAAMHVNKLTGSNTLSTAHNIEVDSTGVGVAGGGRNGSRWYEIGNMTSTPTLIQAGTLFDSATLNAKGYWIPSVAISGQGHMALGCSYAASNAFAGIAVSGRLRNDPPGNTQPPTLTVVSSTAYNVDETTAVHRWGDFSQVVVDPADDMTMWTFQEYCNAANSWAVRVLQLKAPAPAAPTNASPDTLTAGQTTNVTISGSSSSGSEFFDPGPDTGGPGYPNHISAIVNGAGGVTVNSVTFLNPTSIVMNVSVPSNAPAGSFTVTAVNPDGRTVTSPSAILTIRAPPNIPTPVQSQIVARGTDATFSVAATGTSPLSYQWRLNGTTIDGATDSSFTHTNSQCGEEGAYDVVVTNVLGGITGSVAALVIVSAPLITDQPATNQVVNGGQLVSFSVGATNDCGDSLTYQWLFNSTPLASGTNSSYTINSAQAGDTGNYTVLVTNIAGSVTSTVASLTVIVPPVAAFTAGPTSGVAVLSVVFTNLSTAASTYLWDFGDGNTSSALNPINLYTNPGLYSVTLLAAGLGGTNVLTRTNYIQVLESPHLVINPGSLDFGAIFTNFTASASLTVSNSGGAPLNANAALPAGPFAILSPSSNIVSSLDFAVTAHTSTNLALVFTPVAPGVFSNLVSFTSNGGTSSIPVLGTGITLPLLLSPRVDLAGFAFSFQTATGKSYQVQFKNSLLDTSWQNLQLVTGDGSIQAVTNSFLPTGQKFYRLLIQ